MRALRHLSVPSVFLLLSLPAYADLFVFNSAADFNAVVPGLPVETFESGIVTTLTTCVGPVSNVAGSTCFPAGSLLPGAVYGASPGSGLVLLGPGFATVGNTSKVLGPNGFTDTLNITFGAGGVAAAGFDVFPGPNAGPILISLFSPSNAPLGIFSGLGVLGGRFFGVLSNVDFIGRINIASLATPSGELVDNVRFGTPVPEPSSLLLLASGLAILFRLRSLRNRS